MNAHLSTKQAFIRVQSIESGLVRQISLEQIYTFSPNWLHLAIYVYLHLCECGLCPDLYDNIGNASKYENLFGNKECHLNH